MQVLRKDVSMHVGFDLNLTRTEADKINLDKRLLECNDARPRENQREVRGLKWLRGGCGSTSQ